MKNFVLLLLFPLFISCTHDNDFPENNKNDIKIYLVKDGQIERNQTEVELELLKLENLPWVKSSEIDFYDWSSHMFYLNVKKEREKYTGRYFLVKKQDEPLFLGYFLSPYSSSLSYFPSIIAANELFYPSEILEIGGFGGFYKETMDANIQFKDALQAEGLFRAGIRVDLLSVVRKNSTTVDYTFKVENLENDIIFVLDPKKTGTQHFHYFTNGVSFNNGTKYYDSDFQSQAPENGIPKEWFQTLSPNESMVRTVELNGFSSLPKGKTNCRFSFPGQYPKNSNWINQKGRYWLGDYWVKKEMVLH
ncbi:MAG TPA: hypothetical protein VKA38_09165 [Draconibacterium sp.]|nr:hypothetical protein [Draconibacterium sp.]